MNIELISWNVNSLRARFRNGELKWLQEENPDIFCLQEIKATEEQLEDVSNYFKDYHAYFSSAELTPGYSGVAIFSKNKPKIVTDNLGRGKYKEEGRILQADFDEFKLLNIYFPSGNGSTKEERDNKLTHKMSFYNHVLDQMELYNAADENIIICGDFNIAHNPIDLVNPKAASRNPGFLQQERGLLDRLIAHGYVDSYRIFNQEEGNYTWWSNGYKSRENNLGMRLDHFFISESLKKNLNSAYIHSEIKGSDHCPIGITLDL